MRNNSRLLRGIDIALRTLAALLLASMLLAALHDVPYAYDAWYYHLPFAGRIAGIVGKGQYVFNSANEARFAGFPLLAEHAQALAWWLTGRPQGANLVAFAVVPAFAVWHALRFRVPWHLTVLALMAVPLVHIHATSAYVDLPANAAVAALVLLVIFVFTSPIEAQASVMRRTVAEALVLAAIAVNTKTLSHPIVLAALVALAVRVLPNLLHDRRMLAIVLIALPIVFWTPLSNLVRHGNPYFPVRITVLGQVLPGPEEPYSSSPDWLEHAPQPARFVASLAEVGLRPMTDTRRWTIDQWMPSDARGYRMGGFFGAYVLLNVVILAWRAYRERTRTVRVVAIGVAAFTALVSLLPQSHELRYYMSWMIVVVAANLWLACREGAATFGPRTIGVAAVCALGVVLAVTRGAYAYPGGSTFPDLVREMTDERALRGVADGDRVCVAREPFNLLWAAPFHGARRYVVVEAEPTGDCPGATTPLPPRGGASVP